MITLERITKSFGSNHVLRGVDLTLPKGESMVIIGGSGTGKSILLKCILGLVTQDSGKIIVGGQDVRDTDRDAFLARFGMLFQGGRPVLQSAGLGKCGVSSAARRTKTPTLRGPHNCA